MTNESLSQDFVTFYSPGTFVAEQTTRRVGGWDIDVARVMAADVQERHGAVPYGFRFTTRTRGPEDLDSQETERSPMYYLGGRVRTIEELREDNIPGERTLLSNMECNGWERVWQTTTGWLWSQPLCDGDVILERVLQEANDEAVR